MIAILSGIGLLLGIIGCYFTIRKVMFDVYVAKEAFDLYEENRELFNWLDKLIHKIGAVIFKKYLITQSKLSNQTRLLREGNEIILGFILILIGFLSQLSAIIILIIQK